jgi:hypothetical protein
MKGGGVKTNQEGSKALREVLEIERKTAERNNLSLQLLRVTLRRG